MIGPALTPCDDGVIRGAASTPHGYADPTKPWVLATAIVGSSMAFIDGSVVNVALPAIQAGFGAQASATQWAVNAYMLTLGALILIGGAAGDRFGRRRVFIAGVISFAGASAACGLAPTPAALIAARAFQGMGAALVVPNSLAMVSAAYAREERGRAIGIWAGASALTTALGPVLGGWLVDAFSWRAVFFINLPVAAAATALALWRVPESRNENGLGVDWRGGLLALTGLGALAYGLTAAPDLGWTDRAVLGSLLAGIALLFTLVWSERRAASPMLPLALFRSADFSGANVITLLLYFGLSGALFFVPFNLIRIQGYSAALAGAAFLPFTLILGGLSSWSGGLVNRYGARLPLIIGPTIVAAGFALLAVPGVGGSYWMTFFPPMAVLGLGMSISVAPLTTAVMSAAEDRYAGVASGINNATARIAGMLAVALLGAVAVGVFGAALDERLRASQIPAAVRLTMHDEARRLADAEVPPLLDPAKRETVQHALEEAFVRSFRATALIAACLALLGAACAWLTIDLHAVHARSR